MMRFWTEKVVGRVVGFRCAKLCEELEVEWCDECREFTESLSLGILKIQINSSDFVYFFFLIVCYAFCDHVITCCYPLVSLLGPQTVKHPA